MTLITFIGNNPVMQNGKVATGTDCCSSCDVCYAPSEWRIRDADGNVWFTGEIDMLNGQHRLLDFPANCWLDQPQPWLYLSLEATLVLEVLGCSDQWDRLAGPEAFSFGQCGRIDMNCTFPPHTFQELPEKCRCLHDRVTGQIVPNPNDPNSPCIPCPSLVTTEWGTGLGHLTSGRAVTFTGAVDGEGTNLANWEDADGNSPASAMPNETSDVVINSSLTSFGDGSNYLSVKSITINGCQFSAPVEATDLWATDAEILAKDACNNFFGIVLSGKATLTRSTNAASITGDCDFLDGSTNFSEGFLSGSTILFEDSDNYGYIAATSSCTFRRTTGSAGNAGPIFGSCTFISAGNSGPIAGDCVFDDYGTNATAGSITGDCSFSNNSDNQGAITGAATFTTGSVLGGGSVTGNCSLDTGSYLLGGTVGGGATFGNGSYMVGGTVANNATFSGGSMLSGGTIGGDATFNDSQMEYGTITGSATFSGGSTLFGGTIGGDATLGGGSRMEGGNVTGTATFTGGSCYVAGTAGTFDPAQPPECDP